MFDSKRMKINNRIRIILTLAMVRIVASYRLPKSLELSSNRLRQISHSCVQSGWKTVRSKKFQWQAQIRKHPNDDEATENESKLSDKNHEGRVFELLSRRNALLAAASLGGMTLLHGRFKIALLPNADAEELKDFTQSQFFDLITDYNKAPGMLVIYPDSVVEKSPSDKYSYRALTLPNGLRVLLASDPKVDNAAAALDVHVGHYSDPAEIPGLAHFNEHMLFLGNKKFPGEGQLESFLSAHGGSSNAFTASEDTCYFFTVDKDSLQPALERFSQFFVSPLFTASATERELNAIESENSKNLQTDSWRFSQVFKLRSNPKHPFAKFGTGNRATLKEGSEAGGQPPQLRDRLLDFYSRYYTANQMTLAVCGREDLDTLQTMVVRLFSDVPNSDAPPPEIAWAGRIPPFDVRRAPLDAYGVVPVDDVREMSLQWILPFRSAEDRERRRAGRPDNAVGAVLGFEGPGSLLSYLKDRRGLVSSLAAAVFEEQADFQVFGVAVSLTPEGLAQREAIGQAIFSYLKTIKEEGIPNYILDETVGLADLFWEFRERRSPGELVNSAVSDMQDYMDPRKYLSGPGRIPREALTQSLVKELLSELRPEAAMVTYAARNFASRKDLRKERWYGTLYFVEPSPAVSWAAAAVAGGRVADLRIPPPNPFVPAKGSLKLVHEAVEDLATAAGPPQLVRDDAKWQVWFKDDQRYGQPKATIFFQLVLPNGPFGAELTPRTSALAKLYRLSLQDALNEYAYPAAAAGLQYAVDFTPRGAQVQFSGFSARLGDFATAVTRAAARHVPADDEVRFARFKDIVGRDLRAFDSAQPYQHATFYAKLYRDLPSYEPREVEAELKTITLSELRDWASAVYRKAFGRALVQGNLRREEADRIVAAVELAFTSKALPEPERAEPQYVIPPLTPIGAGSLLRRPDPGGSGNPNGASVLEFVNSDRAPKQRSAMEVIGAAIEQPFYAELRTRQQLGYIVFAGTREIEPGGARALNLVVQSGVANPSDLTSRILKFVETFLPVLEAMPESEFRALATSLAAKRREGERTLSAEVGRHWNEIAGARYLFDRAVKDADALEELTKADILEVYREVIMPNGKGRRLFSSEVYPPAGPAAAGGPSAPPPPGAIAVPAIPRNFIASNDLFPTVARASPQL